MANGAALWPRRPYRLGPAWAATPWTVKLPMLFALRQVVVRQNDIRSRTHSGARFPSRGAKPTAWVVQDLLENLGSLSPRAHLLFEKPLYAEHIHIG